MSTLSISEAPTEAVQARPVSRVSERTMVWALVLLGIVAAGVRFNDQLIGLTGDNANFILLSRSLLISETYDNAETPWLYPALLTPLLAMVGPDNAPNAIPWMKLLTLVFYVASLPLMYGLLRLRDGVLVAAGGSALFGISNITLFYANDVMTELPYICVTLGALLFWQRAIAPWAYKRESKVQSSDQGPGVRGMSFSGERSVVGIYASRITHYASRFAFHVSRFALPWRQLLLAAVLIVAAYYFRTVGLALIAGAVLTLLWHRKVLAAIASALAMAALALPWALYANAPERPNYVSKLFLRDPYNPALGYVSGVGEFLGRLLDSANIYLLGIFPGMLLPDPTPDGVRTLLAPMLFLLVGVGLALKMARRVELPEVYTLLLLGIIFAWPFRGDRFFLPAYPLMLYYVIVSLHDFGFWILDFALRIANRLRSEAPSGPPKSKIVIPLLILASLPHLWLAGTEGVANARYLAGQAAPPHHTPDWQTYFEACRWLREHAPPDSMIISRKFTITTLYANRFSIPFPLRPPEQFIEYIDYHNIDYVLEDAFEWSTQTNEYLRPTLQAFPERFELVHTTPWPQTRVWKVRY